jgi:hypothetical protein
MKNAVPHVPEQIAMKLQAVRQQVHVGRVQLAKVKTARLYAAATFDAVSSGYASLDGASQLTGDACGFTLAPDPSVAGWPFGSP